MPMSEGNRREMEIPPQRYFRVGEAAVLIGVSANTLRYWERNFPSLSRVPKRDGRRYYRRDDILTARTIRDLLKREGYTISGARELLKNPQRRREASARATDTAHLRREIADIIRMLNAVGA